MSSADTATITVGLQPRPEVSAALPSSPRRRARQWWRPLRREGAKPLFIAADVLAVLVVSLIMGPYWPYVVEIGALAVVLFATAGLYRSRLTLSLLDDLPMITGRFSVAVVATTFVSLVLALNEFGPPGTLQDRLQAFALVVPIELFAAFVLVRGATYAVVRKLRTREDIAHRTVVIGTDAIARDIVQALRDRPSYGLRPVGHLESSDQAQGADAREGDQDLDLPVLGDPRDLGQVLERYDARVVIASFDMGSDTTLLQVIRMAHRHECEVFVVPRLHELHPVASDVENVWGIPLVRLRRAAYRTAGWRLKRLLDVLVSAAALTVLAPVLAACAMAVRLDGGPGVIFRQQRVGVDGRHFEVLKFRSMRPATDGESATTWSIANDSRLSPVGRFLRRTSLDELPQLWNILRGDMSLVGPRPERPHFVQEFVALYPSYGARHRVPCGLTGWAQVNGLRGDTSIDDRARFDNFYVENWSLWFDIKIILRTFWSVVAAKGA